MNALELFYKWRNKLSHFPQAAVDFILGGLILIVVGILLGLIAPIFLILSLIGFGLLSLGNLFLAITIGLFVCGFTREAS